MKKTILVINNNMIKLPYSLKSLEPYLSERTLSFHYEKHHQTYFDNLNKLINGTDLADLTLEEIIRKSYQVEKLKSVFNNAAQTYNHNFYWQSLSPEKKEISNFLLKKIEENFSSLDSFKQELKDRGVAHFASGWVWLVLDGADLKIISSSNADTPITSNLIPLLVLDLWEHAYYLDYQNLRAKYLETLIDNLINWDFCEDNLKKIL